MLLPGVKGTITNLLRFYWSIQHNAVAAGSGPMSMLYDKVVNTIAKPAGQRVDAEIEQLLPWFRKKSDLFQSLHADIVKDIVKNCQFISCKRDTVIIRQMDKGDCFYIILSGSVAIHINTTLTEDEFESVRQRQLEEEAAVEAELDKGRVLDRAKYGIFVGRIAAGKSFGELALINADCVRNATIIADETTDLLSVDRDLYNRSLLAFQTNEVQERKEFVETSPLFHNWQVRYKKMMGFSLKKKVLRFEDTIVRQGMPVDGISFIIKGQCKVRLDPGHHEHQYPHLHPLGDIAEMEREKTREVLRREMNLQESRAGNRPRAASQKRAVHTENKKTLLKPLELCLARAVDTIGDLEMAMGLATYSQTVECTEESIVYHLDQRNYDRLIEKRNPATLEMLRDIVHTKLTLHFSRLQENSIPLYRFFLYTLDEKEKESREAPRISRSKPQQNIEVNVDNLHKGPLVNMYGPGSVFFLIRKRAKEMKLRQRGRGVVVGTRGRDYPFGAVLPGRQRGPSPPPLDDRLAHETTSESMLNLVQSGSRLLHGVEEADFIEDYPGESLDHNDLDIDDSYDYASSDSALTQLEERLNQWHNSLGTVAKGTKVVRLARYQYEDEHMPKPGNKVYVRMRTKPKDLSFFEIQDVTKENNVDSKSQRSKSNFPGVATS